MVNKRNQKTEKEKITEIRKAAIEEVKKLKKEGKSITTNAAEPIKWGNIGFNDGYHEEYNLERLIHTIAHEVAHCLLGDYKTYLWNTEEVKELARLQKRYIKAKEPK
ncbi:30868_t:CDS:2 [Racocetra persica]|uniref:30868_t:CDS:1 n=1 Tax=Racocetra persica TaxID=160502 RepID=A0ACA9LFQ7_9GLOM|nr:30868_t:CDS:2 [Racocetra persica]